MSGSEEGLSSVEAARRLAAYGPNEPVPVRRPSAVVQLSRLFANPLVIILLVASVIAGSLGQHVDALIIVTMVVLGVSINFWQSYRSQQAAERLRSSVIPTATVLRDGAWLETPLRNVVPGDVFRLSAGDLVPADARLLESRDLSVQQSMLTGESLPTVKMASAAAPEDTTDPNAPHLVFLGTSVVSGTGTALAIATGSKTIFGDIAVRLGSRVPETEFEHGLRRFSLLILRTTVVLVLFILLMGIAFKHDAFQSLLFAVALGVGLTPEFLPIISAVTLTRGALRMARDQVIVKHLPAIQDFGAIDILCSDKTGTLTSGVMQFDRAVDPTGASSPRPLTLASINSSFETGIRSPLDVAILQQAAADVAGYQKIDEDPVRFRAAPPVRGCGGAGRRWSPASHHQRCARVDHRAVSGVRSGRPRHAARRGDQAGVRCSPRAHERGWSARPGCRLPLAGASRLPTRATMRPISCWRASSASQTPSCRTSLTCWRSSSATALR
jgi:Mg2+-importing ATPase